MRMFRVILVGSVFWPLFFRNTQNHTRSARAYHFIPETVWCVFTSSTAAPTPQTLFGWFRMVPMPTGGIQSTNYREMRRMTLRLFVLIASKQRRRRFHRKCPAHYTKNRVPYSGCSITSWCGMMWMPARMLFRCKAYLIVGNEIFLTIAPNKFRLLWTTTDFQFSIPNATVLSHRRSFALSPRTGCCVWRNFQFRCVYAFRFNENGRQRCARAGEKNEQTSSSVVSSICNILIQFEAVQRIQFSCHFHLRLCSHSPELDHCSRDEGNRTHPCRTLLESKRSSEKH